MCGKQWIAALVAAGLFFYSAPSVFAGGFADIGITDTLHGGDNVTVEKHGNQIIISADVPAAAGVTQEQLDAVDAKAEQNKSDIATLKTDVTTAQDTADTAKDTADTAKTTADTAKTTANQNTTAITNLTNGQVKTNKDNITALDGRVTQNETDIAANETAITNLTNGQVKTNKDNITALDGRVTTNEGKIGNLQTQVTTNTGDIATNKTDIANLSAAFDTTDFSLHYFKANSDITHNDDAQAAGEDAIAIGSYALSEGDRGVSIGKHANVLGEATDAIAIGTNALSEGERGVAMGQYATVSEKAKGGIAIGSTDATEAPAEGTLRGAYVNELNGVAIGTDAEVASGAESGVAIGEGAITGARSGMSPAEEGMDTILVGGGKRSVAIGHKANARANSSIALGDGATVFNSPDGMISDGIALGTNAKTNAAGAMAIGKTAYINSKGMNSLAIGNETQVTKTAAIALGYQAKVAGNNGIALGTGAVASGDPGNMIAVGHQAQAVGAQAIALGDGAKAPGDNTIAIGDGSSAAAYHSIVIGEKSGIGMVDDAAHVNGAHIVIGKQAGGQTNGQEDIAIGTGAGTNVSGNYNIAIGSLAGTNIGAAGDDTNSKQLRTVSIGYHSNNYDTQTSLSQATAIGSETRTANQATAIGASAIAEGNGSTAIGFEAHAEGEKTMAFGEQARATGVGHIALGGGALATDAMAQGLSYLTKETATQVISVGNGNGNSEISYRRIVNVADGSQDHDAVTVRQLRSLQDKTASLVGVSLDPEGKYGGLTYKGASYASVQAVLNELDPTMGTPGGTPANAVIYTNADHTEVALTSTTGDAPVKITNLAEGIANTDAVNVGQMKQAIDAAKVHYYAVKTDDAGTAKNNYNNDGASGVDSIALGIQAKATNIRSVALGNNTSAQSKGSIALGAGYEDESGITDTVAEVNSSYSTAIGAGAQASGTGSIAIGTRAVTKEQVDTGLDGGKESIALGYFAQTSNQQAIAMGSHALTTGLSSTAIGTNANSDGEHAIAMGTNAFADANSSGAIGHNATLTKSSNTYVIGTGASATYTGKSNILGTGSSITAADPTSANITESTIVGNNSTVTQGFATGVTDVVMSGNRNTIKGGENPETAGQGVPIEGISVTGHGNTIQAPNNDQPLTDVQIIGNHNTLSAAAQVNPDNPDGEPMDKFAPDYSHVQVLGSNVTVSVGNSVYLGSENEGYLTPAAHTAGGAWYNDVIASTVAPEEADLNLYTDSYVRNFAGLHAVGVVSVGKAGAERRIQNVAAGLVSHDSTDAINGSQLYAQTLPLRFAGDNSTIGATSAADDKVLHRGSDQAMSIVGGAPVTNLTDQNIGVVANKDDNTLTVKLNKDVKGLNSIEATTGQFTTVNSTTVNATTGNITNVNATTVKAGDTTINTAGLSITNGPVVTKTNVSMNNQQIHNVLAGTADTDAVNLAQLKEAKTEVKAGTNVTITSGTDATDGHAIYTVNAKDTVVQSGVATYGADGTGTATLTNNDDTTATITGLKDTYTKSGELAGNTITFNRNDGTTYKVTGIASTADAAASKTEVKAGTNITSVDERLDPNDKHTIYTVNAKDTVVQSGVATYGADGTGTATLTNNDGSTATITGLKDTVVKSGVATYGENGTGTAILTNNDDTTATITGLKDTYTTKAEFANHTITFTRNDETDYNVAGIASVNDGLTFAGNTGSKTKKLNETMKIKGTGDKANAAYDSSNIKTWV